jgi:hypothetical protein
MRKSSDGTKATIVIAPPPSKSLDDIKKTLIEAMKRSQSSVLDSRDLEAMRPRGGAIRELFEQLSH